MNLKKKQCKCDYFGRTVLLVTQNTCTHTHTSYVLFHVLAKDLQSDMLNCYVQIGSCFCGPSYSFSIINNNGRDTYYKYNEVS